jgi:HK97 family phage prohead protease
MAGGGRELRTFTPALRLADVESVGAGGRKRFLHGRAVPFGVEANVGWYLEEHVPGCFDKSIREAGRRLPLLLFHDAQRWPIGSASEWKASDEGLDGVWQLDESEESERAARMADDGHLTGLSIGFMPIQSRRDVLSDDEWDPEAGRLDKVWRIESRLLEVSLVPAPAFVGAGVTLVRSSEPHRGRPAVEGERRAVPTPWLDHYRELRATL